MEGRRRLYVRSGRASSEGRGMTVGSSWSWRPPRGGSTVDATQVGRGQSRAKKPHAIFFFVMANISAKFLSVLLPLLERADGGST